MTSNLEKLEDGQAKLIINVDAATFEEGINQAYKKMRGQFAIDGFRKGKVPRTLIERHYGPQVFYEDAFEEIFPKAYRDAVREHNLEVVSRLKPDDVNILKMDPKTGVDFSVVVTLKPDVILGEYKNIPAKKTVRKVTDKDAEAQINQVRVQNARWTDTNDPAQDGDTIIIDYSGSINGEKFHGGTAENQTIIIGSGRFIPGFEEQLIGLKKGDETTIDVTFPQAYHPEVAGKDAVFAIEVKEVKKRELPDLDDDFAQDVSEFDTIEEYKSDTIKRLQKREDELEKIDVENQVLKAVTDNATVTIPEAMIENYIDNQIDEMRYKLKYQGIKLEDYLKYMGNSMEELRKGYRENADEQVKMRLVVDALIDKLGINPTEQEVETYINKLAKKIDKTAEEYKKDLTAEDLEFLKEQATMESLFDYLIENAVIEEVEAPFGQNEEIVNANENTLNISPEKTNLEQSDIMSYADDETEEDK